MRPGAPRRRWPWLAARSAGARVLPLLVLLLLSSSTQTLAGAPLADDAASVESVVRADGPGFVANVFQSLMQGDNDDDADDAAADNSVAGGSPVYEPDFGLFDRGIVGRAPPGVMSLANNVPEQLNVEPGTTQVFVFEKASIFSRAPDDDDGEDAGELRRRRSSESGDAGDGGSDDDGAGAGRQDELRLVRRQQRNATRMIYISANTCIQPQLLSPTISGAAPQLTMYVSTTAKNIAPGPHANPTQQTWHAFSEGAVMVSVNASDDVFVGIAAPNISAAALSGTYNFQVAASVDAWYHSYDNETDANLIWVDSDSRATLLITHNLTDSTDAAVDADIMSRTPYVMFAQNADDRATDGVRFSYCGLQTYAQIAATKDGKFASLATTGMTRTGRGNLPKQQFYFSGLNASSSYVGILAALPQNGTGQIGASVAGGGGKVARATSFTTKPANATCQVVFNMTFCNETAYAVPSNPTRFANATELARVYDAYAAGLYDNFLNVLAQFPCEAPDTQRYSLVRTCADCQAAYKNWLCSVAIPRCADFADNSTWLQPRAISQPFPGLASADGGGPVFLDAAEAARYPNTSAYNASRSPFIDETIAPGPYKEVLPCDDLCYNLVQSCPSAIGFSCPLPGYHGFDTSYGRRTAADQDGYVTCNYPGSAHYFSAAPGRCAPWPKAAVAVAGVASVAVALAM